MPAILVSLLAKILPYLIIVFAAVGAYFGIKAKGKAEAKAAFDKQQEKAEAQVNQRVSEAVGHDAEIDKKAAVEKAKVDEEVNKPVDPIVPGGEFKF